MHDLSNNDRRVRKTRTLLVQALGSLMHEKPYDTIVVKEILHRANVGRSTFYTHFRDKDELLGCAMDDLLERSLTGPASAPRSERLLRFSLPVLEHIDRQRRGADGLPGARGMTRRGRAVLHERLEQQIGELIAGELRRGLGERASNLVAPAELLVRYVTSTFTTVLDWWVESQRELTAREVDRLFRGLVLPALSQWLD